MPAFFQLRRVLSNAPKATDRFFVQQDDSAAKTGYAEQPVRGDEYPSR
jgi:hypothetical protein